MVAVSGGSSVSKTFCRPALPTPHSSQLTTYDLFYKLFRVTILNSSEFERRLHHVVGNDDDQNTRDYKPGNGGVRAFPLSVALIMSTF